MSKQHEFRPTLDDKLECRLVLSGGAGPAAQVLGLAHDTSSRQVQRADRLIQAAYNRYRRELVDAYNDGVTSIETGARSPEIALLGMKNFAVRKEEFLQRQLRASVEGLPFARRALLPQLNQIARSALQALQATTSMAEARAQTTPEAIQPYADLSKQVIWSGGRA